MVTRTNLISNPSFETNQIGWVDEVNTWGRYGRAAFGTVGFAPTATGLARTASTAIAVTPGLPYTLSSYMQQVSDNQIAKLGLRFLDSSGAVVLEEWASSALPKWIDVPQRMTPLTSTAPANAATVQALLEESHNGGFFDAVMLEQSASMGEYFDGSRQIPSYNVSWTGTAHNSTSVAEYNGKAIVKALAHVTSDSSDSSLSVQLESAVKAGDVIVFASIDAATGHSINSITGAGATWSKADTGDSNTIEVWKGIGGSAAAGSIVTVSLTTNQTNRTMALYHIGGTTDNSVAVYNAASGAFRTPGQNANENQVVIGAAYGSGIQSVSPTDFWTLNPAYNTTVVRQIGHRVPLGPTEVAHSFQVSRPSGTGQAVQIVIGDPVGPVPQNVITSEFSSSGQLTTKLTDYKSIDTALSGSGTLTTTAKQPTRVTSAMSGEGTFDTYYTGLHKISTELSGTGTLGSQLNGAVPENPVTSSHYTSSGELFTLLKRKVTLTSDMSGEGVLIPDVSYSERPEDKSFLGKLSTYSVSTAATPLNPANGSGALPTMNAVFADPIDPEFAMGTILDFENPRIGEHHGEIVSVSTADASNRSSISVESPLTLLNAERRVYPVIQAPSTWFAARAIDYWTQQCGLFYDRVPGEVIAYSSIYGHGLAYLKNYEDQRFYENVATPIQVVNNRSVRSFVQNATVKTQLVLDPTNSNMAFARGQRLVFSIGVGLTGTGRTSSTEWAFHDEYGDYSVTLTASSNGAVSAKLTQPNGNSVTTHSATVSGSEAYRLTLSVEKHTATSLGTTFTVDSDNLAGAGSRVYSGSRNIVNFPLPSAAVLDSIRYIGANVGSGAEMYRYGAYLTTTQKHPRLLPEVSKVLTPSSKSMSFVTGFSGNMWDMLNQFCAINRLDVSFVNDQLTVRPRNKALTYGAKLSGMSRKASRRDKYQKVALVNHNSVPSLNTDNLLWRSDSVYQVTTGEVFETTIQTDHSILELSQPKCVTGIEPFPYKSGTGQYVVTGADGYICSPKFWADEGGKIEVELTDKEGEFLIRIIGPRRHHELRSPYRISEGAGDRPALYVTGAGVLNKPETHEINTGARNAKEGYDSVFDSPFLTGIEAVYDTASEMAREYSASNAEYSFNEPNEYGTASVFGQNPATARLEVECGIIRINQADISAANLSANAVPQTTIADFKAALPVGSKIRDEKAKYRGMTIRQKNIKPLKGR